MAALNAALQTSPVLEAGRPRVLGKPLGGGLGKHLCLLLSAAALGKQEEVALFSGQVASCLKHLVCEGTRSPCGLCLRRGVPLGGISQDWACWCLRKGLALGRRAFGQLGSPWWWELPGPHILGLPWPVGTRRALLLLVWPLVWFWEAHHPTLACQL